MIVLAALALGCYFRFTGLDHKVYDGDEVYSSLHMFGETEAPLVRQATRFRGAHDLWLVLHPSSAGGSPDWLAPARALATEEPQSPPAYYELAHFWVGAFGNSIATTRLLSALLSLLALPCAFWLAVELYGSRRAGWLALALVSLSPVQVLFAQQAREYALWSAALLALTAAVLRAMRLGGTKEWALVAALFAFALYVDPLTLLLGGALLLAATLLAARRDWGIPLRCALALGVGLVANLPWLAILLSNLRASSRGMNSILVSRLSPLEVLRVFAGGLRLSFLDLDFEHTSKLGVVSTAVAVIVIVVALAFVVRRYGARAWLFVLLPIAATSLPFVLADLLVGGQRVINFRYFIPTMLFIDLAVVGLLAAATTARNRRVAGAAYLAVVVLLAARIVSCAASARANTWWSEQWDDSIAVARAIDSAPHSLLVSDDYLLYSLALSNYLRPDVEVVLRPQCYLCADRNLPRVSAGDLPRGHFGTVFALGPSPQLQQLLKTEVPRRYPGARYRCINVRQNCTSDLNIEPLLAPAPPRNALASAQESFEDERSR
ncbi:MAG: glycosyltransferase family 39 protein [Vulcanimicrobiaceae bacterium]